MTAIWSSERPASFARPSNRATSPEAYALRAQDPASSGTGVASWIRERRFEGAEVALHAPSLTDDHGPQSDHSAIESLCACGPNGFGLDYGNKVGEH